MSDIAPIPPPAAPAVAQPHKRSTLVFVLGVLSVVLAGPGLLLGLPGILLGRKPLKQVAASAGQIKGGLLKAGFILSIIGTVLSLILVGVIVALVLTEDDNAQARSALAREALSESGANQFPGKVDEAGSKCFGDTMVDTFGVDKLISMGFLVSKDDAPAAGTGDLRLTKDQATTVVHDVLGKCNQPGSLRSWIQENVHSDLPAGTSAAEKACIDTGITDVVAQNLAVVALSGGDISTVEDPIVGPCLKA